MLSVVQFYRNNHIKFNVNKQKYKKETPLDSSQDGKLIRKQSAATSPYPTNSQQTKINVTNSKPQQSHQKQKHKWKIRNSEINIQTDSFIRNHIHADCKGLLCRGHFLIEHFSPKIYILFPVRNHTILSKRLSMRIVHDHMQQDIHTYKAAAAAGLRDKSWQQRLFSLIISVFRIHHRPAPPHSTQTQTQTHCTNVTYPMHACFLAPPPARHRLILLCLLHTCMQIAHHFQTSAITSEPDK